jgi:hypothetical protein
MAAISNMQAKIRGFLIGSAAAGIALKRRLGLVQAIGHPAARAA